MPPPRGHNAVIGVRRPSVRLSVRPSDVAYSGSNSKTKRPRKMKLCTGVPQVTCDSHTDLRSKGQKSRWGDLAAQLVKLALKSVALIVGVQFFETQCINVVYHFEIDI